MKRLSFLFTLLIIFGLSACTLPAPGGGGPQAASATTTVAAQDGELPSATQPAADAPSGDQAQPAPTHTQPPAVTSTAPADAQAVAPTATTQAQVAGQDSGQAPTNTPVPLIKFDPNVSLGKPSYVNNFEVAYLDEWVKPETKKLPDNTEIRLQFKDGKLYVTGKQKEFSTWWFSYHNLKDSFLEMTFDTETCSGGDTYGIILRGPAHLAGVSYGYVVAFTCDGQYWVFRLDGIDPWETKELVDETKTDTIKSGSNKQNVIGVRADGETLTVYANGYQIAQVKDDEYSQGRIGVFVRAANTTNFTYRVTKLAYWVLNPPK